jgi:hypothetical protein
MNLLQQIRCCGSTEMMMTTSRKRANQHNRHAPVAVRGVFNWYFLLEADLLAGYRSNAVETRIMSFAGNLTRKRAFSSSNVDTAEHPFSAIGRCSDGLFPIGMITGTKYDATAETGFRRANVGGCHDRWHTRFCGRA